MRSSGSWREPLKAVVLPMSTNKDDDIIVVPLLEEVIRGYEKLEPDRVQVYAHYPNYPEFDALNKISESIREHKNKFPNNTQAEQMSMSRKGVLTYMIGNVVIPDDAQVIGPINKKIIDSLDAVGTVLGTILGVGIGAVIAKVAGNHPAVYVIIGGIGGGFLGHLAGKYGLTAYGLKQVISHKRKNKQILRLNEDNEQVQQRLENLADHVQYNTKFEPLVLDDYNTDNFYAWFNPQTPTGTTTTPSEEWIYHAMKAFISSDQFKQPARNPIEKNLRSYYYQKAKQWEAIHTV